eukprot:m.29473 g.29473  ORF g.29473 m.29473 type:complete len:89 (+) comp16099_c0_seq1:176-442(+)
MDYQDKQFDSLSEDVWAFLEEQKANAGRPRSVSQHSGSASSIGSWDICTTTEQPVVMSAFELTLSKKESEFRKQLAAAMPLSDPSTFY